MSRGITVLHSHSLLERDLGMPKHMVLVDSKYKDVFSDCGIELKTFKLNNIEYVKVPILSFVHKGGVFKGVME